MKTTNKKLIILIIILLSVIAIALSGILIMLIMKGSFLIPEIFDFNYNKSSSQVFYDESYNADTIENINIDSDCGDIYIRTSNDNSIRVAAKGRYKDALSVSNNNGSLSVIYNPESKANLFSTKWSCDIAVYLPENYQKPISIDLSYGDIEAAELSSANIQSSYGDIEINRISGKFDIKSNCGDIEINSININEKSSIASNLGDISIEQTNDIRIESAVSLGDNEINYSNQSSDVVLSVTADLGDVEIN